MKTFKNFLFEVKKTHRIGLYSISQLSLPKFINLIKQIDKEYKGILSSDKIEIREKIDGSSLKFGIDKNDEFFIETSYSGPVKAGEYVNYVRKLKGIKEVPDFVQKFDELSIFLKNNKKLINLLKKQKLKYDLEFIKYIGEILYNPLGKEKDNYIRFVSIHYDKSKLGEIATFVPIGVITNKELNNTKELIKELESVSSKELKIIQNIRKDIVINISTDIKNFFKELEKHSKDWEKIIKSRKKQDKEKREILRKMILEFQINIENKINELVKKGMLGNEFEGLVLNFGDKLIKTQTKEFKQNKTKYFKVEK